MSDPFPPTGRPGDPDPSPPRDVPPGRGLELPMAAAVSQFAELARPVTRAPTLVAPRKVPRGVVIFDLDGTILNDLHAISLVAADVLSEAFGTPPEEGRIHYLATTGMPFEAQLAQLYPDAPPALRSRTAKTFHERKVREAYAQAEPFPEVPKLLKRLAQDGWTLAISTGAEAEMAELILEREGLRFWFEDVLGSADGTKREHLREYRRRFPDVPLFLVGDSRFDMEAASSVDGVTPLGRASRMPQWTLAPSDLVTWGARWADYSLSELPEALQDLTAGGGRRPASTARSAGRHRKPPRKRPRSRP